MKFALCGAGRVGTSLASSLESVDWEFFGYYSRSYPKFVEKDKKLSSLRELEGRDLLVFLALPDRVIEIISGRLPCSLLIGHTSGSLDYKAIKAPEPKGRFSIHPLRSIPKFGMDISGGYWGIEGDEVGIKVAEKTVEALNGKALYIDSKMKSLYHMASVMSTNLINCLLFLSDELFKKCGITCDIAPYVGGEALQFIKKLGYFDSLTGPIERGDYNTLEKDLKSLEENASDLIPLVTKLLEVNLDIAKKKGLKKENVDRIYSIISNYS